MKKSIFYVLVLSLSFALSSAYAQSGNEYEEFEEMMSIAISEETDGIIESRGDGDFDGYLVHVDSYYNMNRVTSAINRVVREYTDLVFIERMSFTDSREMVYGVVAITREETNEPPVVLYVGFSDRIQAIAIMEMME